MYFLIIAIYKESIKHNPSINILYNMQINQLTIIKSQPHFFFIFFDIPNSKQKKKSLMMEI